MKRKIADVLRSVVDFLHAHGIRLFVVLATVTGSAALIAPASAEPQRDSHSGKIVRLETVDPLYNPEDEAAIIFEVENDSDVKLEYRAEVIVLDPSGKKAYDSTRQIDAKVTLSSGSSRTYTFYWEIPDDAEEGTYTISGVLKDWDDSDVVYDVTIVDYTFEVIIAPKIFLSKNTVVVPFEEGKAPEGRIEVRNSGEGVLEWEVVDWPEEWVVIVSPSSKVTGPGTVRVRARRSSPWPTDPDKPITIAWNNGTEKVFVKSSSEPSGKARTHTSSDKYRAGEEIIVYYEARNYGLPRLKQDYRISLRIFDPEGKLIFDSEAAPGKIDSSFTFTPDQPKYTYSARYQESAGGHIRLFSPGDAPIGEYTVSETLYQRWPDSSIPEKLVGSHAAIFEITEGARLTIEPDSWDFGSIQQGKTPTARLAVYNGTRHGTLTWSVTGWPDWMELIRPTSDVIGADNIRLEVKKNVSPGTHSGSVIITSNAGTRTLRLSVNVLASEATNTPVPTSTMTPTATATPPPTPVMTETPQPTATRTRTAVSSFPTSTPVAASVAPTATRTSPPRITNPIVTRAPTITPTPRVSQGQSIPAPTATAVVVSAANLVATLSPRQEPGQTGAPATQLGDCNGLLTHIPLSTGLANLLVWIAPLAMISGYRRLRYNYRSPTGIIALVSRCRRKTR